MFLQTFSNPNQTSSKERIIRLACCAVISVCVLLSCFVHTDHSTCQHVRTPEALVDSGFAYRYTQMDAQAHLPTTIQGEETSFFLHQARQAADL